MARVGDKVQHTVDGSRHGGKLIPNRFDCSELCGVSCDWKHHSAVLFSFHVYIKKTIEGMG